VRRVAQAAGAADYRDRTMPALPGSRVSLRQAGYALGAFGALVVVGTVGFALINDESVFDALYRTVITVYTAGLVGAPDTFASKLFTLVLVVWGVGIFLYVFGLVIELTIGGTLSGAWEQRRMERRLAELEDHVIICGFGRVGRRAAKEFTDLGVPFVVLDLGEEAMARARQARLPLVEGSGTSDEELEQAGIMHARALIASADSDVDNLYVTLSARAKRPDMFIVARTSTRDAAEKLRLAGANRVVQPYATAGLNMANLVLKPQVADFLDIVTTAGGPMPELRFEEIVVIDGCRQCGRSLRDVNVQETTGAVIIALRKRDGAFDVTPAPDTVLEKGDILIGAGTVEEITRLEALFAA